MSESSIIQLPAWPLWRKILVRFFSIYFALQIKPWFFLEGIPGTNSVLQYYYLVQDWIINLANKHLFHIKDVLVPMNGSGDTSYGWAQQCFFMLVALLGCIIWSVLDRKRPSYNNLFYWLSLSTRYYVAYVAFLYGIIKLFAQQMVFPSLSQLATPLGDFLPMRFSWLFIGYSTPYQVFSGIMEIAAGLFLLNRRTASLGALIGLGVFLNVAILNLSYDIPVKIFSMNLLLMCMFLLLCESKRFIAFFITNQPAPASTMYLVPPAKKWMRITRVAVKVVFILSAVGFPFFDSWSRNTQPKPAVAGPIQPGVYDVRKFAVAGREVPFSVTDSLRWKDLIFDSRLAGSIKTADTLFRQRYKRGYFAYTLDTAKRTISFKKQIADSLSLFKLNYTLLGKRIIVLEGKYKNEDLRIELEKSDRHFQLAEKQFHWLSEGIR